jgi:hypothetical protein
MHTAISRVHANPDQSWWINVPRAIWPDMLKHQQPLMERSREGLRMGLTSFTSSGYGEQEYRRFKSRKQLEA